MIDKLTPKQKALIPVIRDKWLDKVFKERKQLTLEEFIPKAKWLYEFCGLKEPVVLVLDSPMATQIAANMANKPQVALQVGSQVKSQVKSQVDSQVDLQVKSQMWLQVHSQVWSQVESQVRLQVWLQVGSQVDSQVKSLVGSQVYSRVMSQVKSQVKSQVRSQVESQVWSQVWSQVRFQVWSQVKSQVESQVWSQVKSQVNEFYPPCRYGSLLDDAYWLAYIEYFKKIGVTGITGDFDKFVDYVDGVWWTVALDGVCVVSRLPIKLTRDANNSMHNEEGMAIEWADGYGQHYLHGVFFDEDLFKKVVGKKMQFDEVMKIKNMEQRMIALKYLDPDELLVQADAKLLDKSERGNELYQIDGLFSETAYFLRYACPSTGRIYVSGVDPEVVEQCPQADFAMAWKFTLTEDEYKRLKVES